MWRRDDRARDRNGSRNALFADLLITTGIRLEEASSLLTVEIEHAVHASANGDKQVAFRLSAGLTKGDKGRTIRIPASLLSRLRSYIEIERAVAVEKFRTRNGIKRIPGARFVLVPASEKTRGHYTYLQASFWKSHLAELMKGLPAF